METPKWWKLKGDPENHGDLQAQELCLGLRQALPKRFLSFSMEFSKNSWALGWVYSDLDRDSKSSTSFGKTAPKETADPPSKVAPWFVAGIMLNVHKLRMKHSTFRPKMLDFKQYMADVRILWSVFRRGIH